MFRVVKGQRFIDGHPNVYFLQSNHRTLETAKKAGKKINTTYQNNSVGNFFFFIQEEVVGEHGYKDSVFTGWKTVFEINANNIFSELFFKPVEKTS